MLGFGEGKNEQVKQANKPIDELRELLLADSNVTDDTGILQLAKKQFTGDLHQRKIARAIEILESL